MFDLLFRKSIFALQHLCKCVIYEKALFIASLILVASICFGQDGGPLKFLGIPIDGTEAQFASQLKSKGFTYSVASECYQGQFNGKPVEVVIHTNHNLVDRVYVAFPYTTEEGIKNEFNRLIGQFKDTGKYMNLSLSSEIPADEDISYEMTVHNKRYQASFDYFNADRDPFSIVDKAMDRLDEFFSKEQLADLKAFIIEMREHPEEQWETPMGEVMNEIMTKGLVKDENGKPDLDKTYLIIATILDGIQSQSDGDVWFMIHETYGRYRIGLYYDNLHNQAHGEDL